MIVLATIRSSRRVAAAPAAADVYGTAQEEMVGTMTVLVEFKTGDRVRLLRPIDGFAAGTEGEIVRIFVAPTRACLVRIGDAVVETEPDDVERAVGSD
jgi:hypothetical protein